MKYKLVIFDFDGTLADTSPGIFNSIRYSSSVLGMKVIPEEQMCSFIGPPLKNAYIDNFGLSGETLERAMQLHKEYGVSNGYKELKFYDGIFDFLSQLKGMGIKTAIATLKVQPTINKIIEEFSCKEYFDIWKGVDLSSPMTKADMLRYCMKQISDVSAEQTVLIGDSKFDAAGAEEAGIDFIAVTYGFGFSNSEKIDYPYVARIKTVGELSDLFAVM